MPAIKRAKGDKKMKLLTVMGNEVSFGSEREMLEHYGNEYDIRDTDQGRALWHKGQRRIVGIIA